MPLIGGKHPLEFTPLSTIIQNNVLLFSYVIFASLGSYFNWINIKRIEDDIKMDKEIIEIEYLFLKNQFYSHLTFNFLNFCYQKIKNISPKAATSVEEFSDILRYSLKATAGLPVLLEKEIEYIENCISFHKSLTTDLNIAFSYEGDLKNIYVFPRILIVFIENSLKHGVCHDPHNPILVSIQSFQNKILFNIENKKSYQIKADESGIGIKNIEQVLHFFYPNTHKLTIISNSDLFSCELQLENIK
jgi:two-component system LytT family sensor kinase